MRDACSTSGGTCHISLWLKIIVSAIAALSVLASMASASQPPRLRTPILYSPPVTRIELVSREAGAGAFGTLGRPWLRKPPKVTLPQGYNPVRLPQGYEAARGKGGEWAVVAEKKSSEPFGSTYAIWIVSKDGRRATHIVSGRRSSYAGIIGWDASGKILAIWTVQTGGQWIGEAKLASGPDWKPQTVLKLSDVVGGPGMTLEPFIGVWSGDKLFLAVGVKDRNQIWEVNARTRKARKVYDEARNKTDHISIGDLATSPDGRSLLFDRSWAYLGRMAANAYRPRPSPGQKPRQITADTCMGASGIWLLDPSTGKARQITRERSKQYHHMLIGWQDNHTLLFARRDRAKGMWDMYKAELRR